MTAENLHNHAVFQRLHSRLEKDMMPRTGLQTSLAIVAPNETAVSSNFAVAHAEFLRFDPEQMQGTLDDEWVCQHNRALSRLAQTPAHSLAELEIKIALAMEELQAAQIGGLEYELVEGCLRDLRAMRAS